MSRLPKLLSHVAEILNDTGESQEQKRSRALVEMRVHIRRERREIDRREAEQEQRWQRAAALKQRGRDRQAREELRNYQHDDNLLTVLYKAVGVHERVLSTARATADLRNFDHALATFDAASKLAAEPDVNSEAAIDQLMESFEERLDTVAAADTGVTRVRDTDDPELDALELSLEHDLSRSARAGSEASSATDSGEATRQDDEVERRLREIREQRSRMKDTLGEP